MLHTFVLLLLLCVLVGSRTVCTAALDAADLVASRRTQLKFIYCVCSFAHQVFDHPSVAAITTFIGTLGLPELAQQTDDSSEESEDLHSDHISGVRTTSLQLVRSPVLGSDAQPAVVGISSMACRTAAGNAVLQLAGVDASQRVPFARWELDRQEQVSAAMPCWVASQYQPHPILRLRHKLAIPIGPLPFSQPAGHVAVWLSTLCRSTNLQTLVHPLLHHHSCMYAFWVCCV